MVHIKNINPQKPAHLKYQHYVSEIQHVEKITYYKQIQNSAIKSLFKNKKKFSFYHEQLFKVI